jgi:hypothetical protein
MGKWNRTLGIAVLAVAVVFGVSHGAASAFAGGRAEVRKQAEASMLVTGTIDIDTKGSVTAYRIEQADALPKAMLDIVDSRVRGWRFEPVLVDGEARPARAPMQLRLITRQDGDRYMLRIGGASFSTYDEDDTEAPRRRGGRLSPPKFPDLAVSNGVSGTVYLVARIGRDGSVEDAIAEQVNLRAIGTEKEMSQFRYLLAEETRRVALRHWKFDFPTTGPDADAPFVSVRVPVDFVFRGQQQEVPGKWIAYVPGPRQDVPWRNWDAAVQAPDAMLAGGLYPDRPKGPRLLTDLDG